MRTILSIFPLLLALMARGQDEVSWTPIWDEPVLCFRTDAFYHTEIYAKDYGQTHIYWESADTDVKVFGNNDISLKKGDSLTYTPGMVLKVFASFRSPDVDADTVHLQLGTEHIDLIYRLYPEDSIQHGRIMLSTASSLSQLRLYLPRLDLPEMKILDQNNELVEVVRSDSEYLSIAHLEEGTYQLVTPMDTYLIHRAGLDLKNSNGFTRELPQHDSQERLMRWPSGNRRP